MHAFFNEITIIQIILFMIIHSSPKITPIPKQFPHQINSSFISKNISEIFFSIYADNIIMTTYRKIYTDSHMKPYKNDYWFRYCSTKDKRHNNKGAHCRWL